MSPARVRERLPGLVSRALWLAAIALLAIAATAVAIFAAQRSAMRWVSHSREVSRIARLSFLLAVDRETALRGYLLSGDVRSLDPDRAARAPLAARLDSLEWMTRDHAAQQARLRAVRGALAAWERGFATPVTESRVRPGQPVLDGGLYGKELFDVVRARFTAFLNAEDALYRARAAHETRLLRLGLAALLLEAGVVVLALLVLRARALRGVARIEAQQVQLEEQAVELEHQVEEAQALTAELERANAQLSATTSSIAHDLRSPLRALDGYSRILELDHAERLDGEGRRLLGRLRANSQRMGELIDGVLALARLGRGELRRERVDLSALAHQALEDLRRAEPHRRLEAHVAPGLSAVGDPRLLALVVQNLLGNAVKFTRDRDPAVVAFEQGTGAGGERTFCVRDNGVGFDPAHAARLFEPFQRLHHADEFEGHGIGLASVRRVVERHGGRVWATAEPGGGATFCFTLDEPSGDHPGLPAASRLPEHAARA